MTVATQQYSRSLTDTGRVQTVTSSLSQLGLCTFALPSIDNTLSVNNTALRTHHTRSIATATQQHRRTHDEQQQQAHATRKMLPTYLL